MSGVGIQGLVVFSGRVIIRVSQFVAFFILARFLTPAQFGWFGLVTTAIGLAAVLGSLGLRQSFTYEIGQGRLTSGQAIGTSLAVWLPLSLLSSTVIFLVYGSRVEGISTLQAAIFIVLGVAASILLILLQGVFLGKGVIWAFSLSEALPRIALMIGAVGLLMLPGAGLQGALWVQILSFLLPLPVVLLVAMRVSGRIGTAFRRFGAMLKYGLIFAVNLFIVTLSARVSMFIIEAEMGSNFAGQFFAASRVNDIVLEIAIAFGLVLFSNTARSTDASATVRRNVSIAAWMFWLFMLVAVVVVLAAPFVLYAALGPGYDAAVPGLQVMALALAPAAANKMIYPTLAGSGHPYFGTPVLLGSLLVNGAIAWLLVPSMGVVGGAIGLAVGQWLVFIGYATTCRIRFKIPFRTVLIPNFSLVRLELLRRALRGWRRS